ncbi:MAG: hypothetical protein Tsb0014_11250 [Pleurocapsa sp.]
MSSILLEIDGTNLDAPESLMENLSNGLDIVGKQGEANIFEIIDSKAGPSGDDNIAGGLLNDIIKSGAGDDNLSGNDGNDDLYGGEGDDLIRGGEGDDLIIGGKGSDVLIGGKGADVFEFFAEDFESGEMDMIRDFEGIDTIRIKGLDPSVNVEYDSQTGYVSIDGQDAIHIGKDLDITTNDSNNDGDWELF